MKMSNSVYDVMKWVVIIVLPALTVFYEMLAVTWGWPYADQITTTINGFALFLGTCMMISTSQYNKSK